jgi:hypothetical protein
MPAQTAAHRAAPPLHRGAVPLPDAARALGTTTHALRMRIRRGRLVAQKRDGLWYVVLPAAQDAVPCAVQADQGVQSALVAELRSRVAFLERLTEQQAGLIAELSRRGPQSAPLATAPREPVTTRVEAVETPPVPADPTPTTARTLL